MVAAFRRDETKWLRPCGARNTIKRLERTEAALLAPSATLSSSRGSRPPSRAGSREDAGHDRRKAGKDFYHVAFLAARENALPGALASATAALAPLLERADAALLEFARDIARREADATTRAWLRRFGP